MWFTALNRSRTADPAVPTAKAAPRIEFFFIEKAKKKTKANETNKQQPAASTSSSMDDVTRNHRRRLGRRHQQPWRCGKKTIKNKKGIQRLIPPSWIRAVDVGRGITSPDSKGWRRGRVEGGWGGGRDHIIVVVIRLDPGSIVVQPRRRAFLSIFLFLLATFELIGTGE